MRICHLVRQYEPGVGGLESFVAGLTREMRGRGHTCEVITLDRLFTRARTPLSKLETIDSVIVHRVAFIGHRRLFAPVIARGMLDGYDVLHVHGIDGMFERVARAASAPHQVRVATTHGLFFHTKFLTPLKRLYFLSITRMAASAYDGLIATSSADAQAVQSLAHPVELIPNGVDPLGDFTATGRDLLYLGRLAAHKQVDHLLQALAEPVLQNTRLHIVGGEWDVKTPYLEVLATRLGVADRVIFHGKLENAALQLIARKCGLFVSASAYEGFGMSLIEAMSIGLVPVVHGNASFRELVAASPVGATVDFANPASASRAIRRELEQLSPARRAQAILFANRFGWAAHADRTLNFYRNLQQTKSSRPAAA